MLLCVCNAVSDKDIDRHYLIGTKCGRCIKERNIVEDDKAKRFNKDKPNLSLLPREACEQEARVWMFGEQKYGRDNWKKLWGNKTIEVCTDSLLRHAFAIASGELFDSESGLSHAAHIRCNAAMILEYQKQLKETELPLLDNELIDIDIPTEYSTLGGGIITHWQRETIHRRDLDKYPGAKVVK